jgi:hypothetical protein
VLDNRERLKEYGNNSMKTTNNYTPKAVVKSLEVLYAGMLNEKIND